MSIPKTEWAHEMVKKKWYQNSSIGKVLNNIQVISLELIVNAGPRFIALTLVYAAISNIHM